MSLKKAGNTFQIQIIYWKRWILGKYLRTTRKWAFIKAAKDEFTNHLNSHHDSIKFTTEEEIDGKLPMLDVLTCRQPDGSITASFYGKTTHTVQYLAADSHHPLQHKLGVIRTLFHRAETVCTTETQIIDEKQYVQSALIKCGYQDWQFKLVTKDSPNNTRSGKDTTCAGPARGSVVVPYVQGTS